MARKQGKSGEAMLATEETTTARVSYDTLFNKIDALQGDEKKKFTKSLTKEEKLKYIEHVRERDCEMVTGIFRCFEPLGGMLEMSGKAFDGEDPVKYSFHDGKEYRIPRYIAKRFENEFQGSGTWYPTHSHILDAAGKPTVNVGKKNRRFGFSSMEFQ